MNWLKKNILGILVLGAILAFGTFVFKTNSAAEQALKDNPAPGHYYVFKDFPKPDAESIMKIKEVRENEIVFYIPEMELLFGYTDQDDKIKELDEEGKMYSAGLTMNISKEDIKQYHENDSFAGAIAEAPSIFAVFE